MKKERRWMKSVIAASVEAQAPMPWQRGQRRPHAAKPAARGRQRAMAAR